MLASCVAALALLAGPASAAQSFRMTYHEEGTRVHQNFCGSAGLTVSDDFVIDGKVRAVPHGPDRLDYFVDTRKETSIVTNLANRQAVTFVLTVTAKDLKVTDNGDGTLTIIALFTGNVVLYGHDGNAIGRDPGQSRFELLIDHGGTPTDPADDQFISERRVKGSTGRTDDLCVAAVRALS